MLQAISSCVTWNALDNQHHGIDSFVSLQELDLSGCDTLTDVGVIAAAENCPCLEVLRLASCQRLTDCTFVALGSFCSRLRVISACGCYNLSDLGITCLAQGAR